MPTLPILGNGLVLAALFSRQIKLVASQWDWILAHPLLAFGIVLAILVLLWLCWDTMRLCLGEKGFDLQARQRAETLLQESVSPDQYRQLQQYGYLEITSTIHADRCYRIPRQRRRVQVLQSGQKVGELCMVTLDPVPDADLVLTHKWMLESNEEDYLATANWMRCTY